MCDLASNSVSTSTLLSFLQLLPEALRAAQACQYLIYSEADFEVFRLAGATRCTDGGKIWHGEDRRLCARFRHEGVGVQKQFLMPLDRGRFVVVHPCSTF